MTSLVEAISVRFDTEDMWVALSDGRTLGVPLPWFPGLFRARPKQRDACRISRRGLHWDAGRAEGRGRVRHLRHWRTGRPMRYLARVTNPGPLIEDDETEAEARALAVAIAESDADPRTVPHEDVRAWLLRLAGGEFDAPPPEPR
jgi:hypothetical protein